MCVGDALINWLINHCALKDTKVTPFRSLQSFFQQKKIKFRAGHKLVAAIKEFGIDCDGKIALDSGLSTGEFTDCLLQHGASHVYGVDVGFGQVNNYSFEII